MKKLIFSLFALALFCSPAFASTTIQEDGVLEGNVHTVNISTDLDVSISDQVATVTSESTLSPTTVTVSSNLTVNGLLYLPYYAKGSKPASGLAVGAIVLQKGIGRGDCGHATAGNNNTFNICASDGTNWVVV